MVKKRLIACLIWNSGMVVQSRRFKLTNVIGNAYTAVDFFNSWAIDEIIIVDVSRTPDYRENFYEIINGLSERCFVPLTAGGWVKSTEDIRTLLKNGADKVIINTEAIRRPELIKESSLVFGSQCIVISIDVKKNEKGDYEVYIDHGRESTGMAPFDWAKKAQELGAGEIFLTSIDQDGSLKGYDLNLIKKVSDSVDIPVIASGGVGNWQHLVEGIQKGGADAVSVANLFHFTEHSTKKAKEYMLAAGLDVRDPLFYKVKAPRRPIYEV